MPIFKRWRNGNDDVFIVDGIALEAPNPPVSRSVRKSLQRNKYESAEAYLVSRLVRPGDTVLDLGAGLGLTAILAAKASGGGRVVAYEANPAIAPLAEKNARRNGVQVEIRNRAVAAKKGACEFHIRRSFPASSFAATKGSKTIQIEADAAQEVIDEIRPDVIICDIEGIEREVLAKSNLPSVQRMVVEVHPQIIGLLGVVECTEALALSGFRLVPSLCFEQVLVFDRDGSCASIPPFSSRGQTIGKAPTI
jgi:FkbM family methyltransferase